MIITNRSLFILSAIVFLSAVLALSVTTGTPNRVGANSTSAGAEIQQPGDKDNSEWAQCETYCDPYKPGTSVAEIRWRVSPQDLTTNELIARTSDEVLEVSVYKDGFQRNLYADVQTLDGTRNFSLLNVAPAQRRIPGLDKLVLVDMNTSPQETKGFRLLAEDPAGGGGEWAVAKVHGLQPGLLYFWRVKVRTSGTSPQGVTVISCQAATCPVDSRQRRPR
jgi:hypothetical protein